jgi:hypothetical protein
VKTPLNQKLKTMLTQDYAVRIPTSYQKVFAAQRKGERIFLPSSLVGD